MIWCVEDTAAIRDIEVFALRSTGFEAEGFEDGNQFWEALQKERPELVLLDVMLPGIDGVELLRRIRSSPTLADLPIIMVTAKGAEFDKVQSLDLGADDYIVKPFGVMEMISRIKAVLRRYRPGQSSNQLSCGKLEMDIDKHIVTANGVSVTLTYKEFELLRLFMSHPGTAFSREQLFSSVWGDNFIGETRTLDMHIRTLRQKLGEYGMYIETVRNVGYRMRVQE